MLLSNIRNQVPQVLINYLWHLPIGIMANIYYGFPSKKLTVIGVTGTDGKTTTVNMLYHILHQANYPVAMISTVNAKIGSQEIDTGFHVTTPNSFLIQKLLKQMVFKGVRFVVLETTSHGLDQFRLWGINFNIGIVTNITMDHLDYHKTWEKYLLAKAKLFSHTKTAILNQEDKSYSKLVKLANGKIITYGEKMGNYNLGNTKLKLVSNEIYNQINALAAFAAAEYLGIEKKEIINSLSKFNPVSGRMELIQKTPFAVYVDFAHTPNALKNTLIQLRSKTKGKVISVFGCAGGRDPYRRRMGEVSAKLSDITIITAEDPREEGVEAISKEISSWAQKARAVEISLNDFNVWKVNEKSGKSTIHIYVKIPDRKEAISFAVKIADKGDVVGIFGKGHEKSMCYGKTEIHWSDQEVVKEILSKLIK